MIGLLNKTITEERPNLGGRRDTIFLFLRSIVLPVVKFGIDASPRERMIFPEMNRCQEHKTGREGRRARLAAPNKRRIARKRMALSPPLELIDMNDQQYSFLSSVATSATSMKTWEGGGFEAVFNRFGFVE